MERRVEFMILEFVGRVLLNVLKAMVWMALLMLRCVLGLGWNGDFCVFWRYR